MAISDSYARAFLLPQSQSSDSVAVTRLSGSLLFLNQRLRSEGCFWVSQRSKPIVRSISVRLLILPERGLIKVKRSAKRSNKAGGDTFSGRIYIARRLACKWRICGIKQGRYINLTVAAPHPL
jgi:hypothetical protein